MIRLCYHGWTHDKIEPIDDFRRMKMRMEMPPTWGADPEPCEVWTDSKGPEGQMKEVCKMDNKGLLKLMGEGAAYSNFVESLTKRKGDTVLDVRVMDGISLNSITLTIRHADLEPTPQGTFLAHLGALGVYTPPPLEALVEQALLENWGDDRQWEDCEFEYKLDRSAVAGFRRRS